jgi:3'(2'), 5'-bisphosphate nucleotidase
MLDQLTALAEDAGQAILEHYASPEAVQTKADDSPLTAADLAAHQVISAGLAQLAPEIPVLSEEGGMPDFATRQSWKRYFLVDPLDGTKEFLKRNGEFTVNIALIENHRPVCAVVHAPALEGQSWVARVGEGAWHIQNGQRRSIHTAPLPQRWRILVSRSHRSPEVEQFLAKCPAHDPIAAGSSLKFCRIASGEADVYPRLGPTSEWDTGAGQCVLEAAGGVVLRTDGSPLPYNTKDDILNPWFIAASTAEYDWTAMLG